jgi:hypothetical protein
LTVFFRMLRRSTTGSAIVSGGSAWRNLSVVAVGGSLVENGQKTVSFPPLFVLK